jgi:toxin-antitoxin system PIN domain toxin
MSVFLPDINVWIALTVVEHDQHPEAIRWFDSTSSDSLAFCRVTQMGFLRLLTNTHVMKGDALTPQAAWRRLDHVGRAVHPVFAPEPALLETAWRGSTSGPKTGPNVWTRAYLAAFARLPGFTFVTFDRGVAQYRNTVVRILDT